MNKHYSNKLRTKINAYSSMSHKIVINVNKTMSPAPLTEMKTLILLFYNLNYTYNE